MHCSNCGSPLDQGTVFCPECGEKYTENNIADSDLSQIADQYDDEATVVLTLDEGVKDPVSSDNIFCPHCGAKNTQDDFFCGTCGKSIKEETGIVEAEFDNKSNESFKKSGVHPIKFPWKWAVAGVGAVIIISLVLLLLPRGKKELIFYAKEDELWGAGATKQDKVLIGDELIDSFFVEEYGGYGILAYGLMTQYSEDGRYLFFPQDIQNKFYNSYTLYCSKANKNGEDAVKIDSAITHYQLLKNNQVVYQKGDDSTIYLHNLEDKEKIASESQSFLVSENESLIIWYTQEGELYIRELKKNSDKVKIDSDVQNIIGCSSDFSKVIYLKSDSVYIYKNLKDKEKLISDVTQAMAYDMDSNFRVSYSKMEETEISCMEFIEDDMESSDAQITEPVEENYQTSKLKEDYWGNVERVVTTSDQYYADYEKYQEKQERDGLRGYLKTQTLPLDYGEVAIYQEETGDILSVAKGYIGQCDFLNSEREGDMAKLSILAEDEITKVKFSDLLQDDYDVYQKIYDGIEESAIFYILKGSEKVELDLEENTYWDIIGADEINKKVYIYIQDESDGKQDLFSVNVDSKNLGDMDKIDSNTDYSFVAGKNDTLYYMKDLNDDGSGELCRLDDTIDYDVYPDSFRFDMETDTIYYMTDVEKQHGTLKFYNGKEPKKIDDDIYLYTILPDQKVAFLSDYSLNKYVGDLKVFNGKEVKKIDSDVQFIFN